MKTFTQLLLFFLLSSSISAQSFKFSKYFDKKDTTQVHVVEMYGGDVFVGRVLNVREEGIDFLAIENVSFQLDLIDIKNVLVKGKGVLKVRAGKLKYGNIPQTTHVYTSTAFCLPEGKHVYQNINLLWNSFDIGLGKGFTVGALVLFPLLNVKGKYTYAIRENVHVGIDVNMLNIIENIESRAESYVFSNGIITLGTPAFYMNITVGKFKSIFDGEKNDNNNRFVGGFGLGGIVKRFEFKVEMLMYRGLNFGDKDEIAFTPSAIIGWKSKSNRHRYNFGVLRVATLDTYLPYYSFQRFF